MRFCNPSLLGFERLGVLSREQRASSCGSQVETPQTHQIPIRFITDLETKVRGQGAGVGAFWRCSLALIADGGFFAVSSSLTSQMTLLFFFKIASFDYK